MKEGFHGGQGCALMCLASLSARRADLFLPLLRDQYLSLCLNQRPAEVFAGCYLNDTKVHFEKQSCSQGETDSCLAMNHTWV